MKISDMNFTVEEINEIIARHKQEVPDFDDSKISDGHHTFDELYEFRKLYNALAFELLDGTGAFSVHKSTRHHDGEECFGGGWFIVTATIPRHGQISNHYKMEDWDLFRIPVAEKALFPFDGHTSQDVIFRLHKLIMSYC